MKKFFGLIWILIIASGVLNAQDHQFSDALFEQYDDFKEESIKTRRFKHADVSKLLSQWEKENWLKIQKIGASIEGRSIHLVSFGNGETDVFLWSQMHGDESTATMAIFDILNFFNADGFKSEKKLLLENLRIHFLPMLNPDGAEKFTRRNALGIDVNRDALRLQSPEGQILKRIRDSLEADFGFNLHDQSKYYNAERTEKPATISFLAPAYNYEKEINKVRGNAMKVIVDMNETIQRYAPGQVGRYNDDFEPRAFGDNIQKWGTSTILIESGGYAGDPEKQEIRKLNFVSILAALQSIASGKFEARSISDYENIPNNDRMLVDLKITGVSYELLGDDYILDLGINLNEQDIKDHSQFYYSGRIVDQGDLSTSYGYKELNADGLELRFGKIYPETITSQAQLKNLDYKKLLNEGFAYLRVSPELMNSAFTTLPLNLVSEEFTIDESLRPGKDANFFLYKDGEMKYAVINGFLTQPENAEKNIPNSLILK